jgi:hypothetical protein
MAQKTYTLNVDVNAPSIGELESQLEQVNSELKNLDRNSDAFKAAAKDAQALNAQLEKTNNAIEGLKLEDKLQAADGAIKVLGGSMQAVVGTLGAIGIESEAFGRFEEKAASAIAVGMGIKDVSEGFGQFAQVMKKSGIAAKLFGSTTSKALIATGVGAFIVVIGTVVAYWDEITAGVKKFAEATPFVGKALDSLKAGFDAIVDAFRPVLEFLGILPDEAERAAQAIVAANKTILDEGERELKLAEARKASAQEIFDIKQKLLKAEIESLKASGAKKEEIYKAETELLALEEANKTRIKEEAAAKEKEIEAKAMEDRKAEIEKFKETADTLEKGLKIVGVATMGVKSAKDQLKESTQAIVPQMTKEHKAIKDNTAALKFQENQQAENRRGMAATADSLQALGSVLDQESTAAKGLAISSALINTYLGVTEALKQPSVLKSPFDVITKVANVATILASGLSAVKNIKSTPKRGGGGGGSMGSRRGPSSQAMAALAPQGTTNFEAPQNLQSVPAVKAYVLSGDVRSGQEAEAKLSQKRTLT